MLDRLRRRRVLVGVLAAVLLLAAGGAVAAYLIVTKQPGDVSNPDVEFTEPEATPVPQKAERKARARFQWPMYGYTKDHRRFFDPPKPVRGPWRQAWRHRAPALTEFPPVIYRGRILQLSDNARLLSLDKRTGKRRWKRQLGSLSAASPAVGGGMVYVTLLESSENSGTGRIVALKAKGGEILWSHKLASRSESSPLLHRGRVYFGSENGTLYAMDARTGKVEWTYRAAGAIKGSPTLADGNLYFGDYGGHVQAVRATDGRRVWDSGAARGLVRSGRFYATAAVAYGRVYIGATDGREYSFAARNGKLAWAHQTGRYIYSSAAVANVAGRGPTVFVGSYDGVFYALDARSGAVRWTYRSGGKISGSPTIIGDTVYFADLGRRVTFGLDTRDGRVAFRREPGAYDPIISDGENLYLTGNSSLTALEPAKRSKAERVKAERVKAKRAKAKRAARKQRSRRKRSEKRR